VNAEEICDALTNARLRQGLNLHQVGSEGSVSRWERGIHWPLLPAAVEWAAALGYELTLIPKDVASAPLASGAESAAVPPAG
jgi:transcriptional regulator with XRE-family HTH domain